MDTIRIHSLWTRLCCESTQPYSGDGRTLTDIVLHQHKYPTAGACLACIHHETPDEQAHERHIADALGVSLQEIQGGRVSPQAAATIAIKFELPAKALVGQAYDSLFKVLCAGGQLPASTQNLEGTLAPFCFVSVLAGALLAIEFIFGIAGNISDKKLNLWAVNPWNAPRPEMRRWREREQHCTFCQDATMSKAMHIIWGTGTYSTGGSA